MLLALLSAPLSSWQKVTPPPLILHTLNRLSRINTWSVKLWLHRQNPYWPRLLILFILLPTTFGPNLKGSSSLLPSCRLSNSVANFRQSGRELLWLPISKPAPSHLSRNVANQNGSSTTLTTHIEANVQIQIISFPKEKGNQTMYSYQKPNKRLPK